MIAALIGALCLAVNVEAELAPDQPLPFVYTGEPLIVELRADMETPATLSLTVTSPQLGAPETRRADNLLLRAQGVRWCAFKDLPAQRGYYNATLDIDTNGTAHKIDLHYCRIDRPENRPPLRVYAHNANDPRAQAALASVGVRTFRVPLDAEDDAARALKLAQQGFRIVPVVKPGILKDAPKAIGELAGAECDNILRWEIDPAGDANALGALSDAIKKAACSAPIAVIAPDAIALAVLMRAGAAAFCREAVLLSDAPAAKDIAAARGAIEQAGYEDWPVHVVGRGLPKDTPADGGALLKQILRDYTMGVGDAGIDAALVHDGALRDTLVYFNGLAARMGTARFAAWLDIEGVNAPLFRSGATWFLPLWADEEADVELELGDASALRLTDAFNNPVALPSYSEGTMTLTVGPQPIYLSGVRGALPAQAASARAQTLAARFAKSRTFGSALPKPLLEAAAAVAADPGGDKSRELFFALIRQLPELERLWRDGQLPRSVAVPAIAQLTRLGRTLCAVEEFRGARFLEPFSDTMARCEEYQSQYLTSSTGAAETHQRGDWLINEVRRLMNEAQELNAADRKIEASAVAALAEWRARCLEFAAKPNAKPEADTAAFDAGDLDIEEHP